jgi:hypothetical protein
MISSAQDSIRYDSDFNFYDGIYLSFDDFRNDNPIDFDNIILLRTPDDPLFMDDLTKARSFRYRDGFGEVRELPTSRIWGFSRGGRPYKVLNAQSYMGIVGFNEKRKSGNNEYGRIIEVGQICLIQVNMQVSSPVQDFRQTGQFLLSIETGETVHYTVANFEKLLKADAQVYDEYAKIRSLRKKKQLFFQTLRRFNRRNPTYFPAYE